MSLESTGTTKPEPNLGQTFWRISSGSDNSCISFEVGNEGRTSRSECDSWQSVGQSLLDGHSWEMLSIAEAELQQYDCLRYIDNGDFLIGIAKIVITPANYEKHSQRVYEAIIKTAGPRSIYRIWNYLPQINREAPGRMENYKLFCSGRTQAFLDHYACEGSVHFPSASATGCEGDELTVVFLAGATGVTHWENPEQIPAYKYPKKYGPCPPTFSRGSRFTDTKGGEWILVAGTAAIKGSETLYPGDFSRQLPVALENMNTLLEQIGLNLAAQKLRRCHFKFFLRNRKNLSALQAKIKDILGPLDTYTIVQADICRADLEVELELTIHPVR